MCAHPGRLDGNDVEWASEAFPDGWVRTGVDGAAAGVPRRERPLLAPGEPCPGRDSSAHGGEPVLTIPNLTL